MPIVDIHGTGDYHYGFFLDINESGAKLLSFDELRFYESDDINCYPVDGEYIPATEQLFGFTPLWDLDPGATDNWIGLNANLVGTQPGSGQGDLLVYLPTDTFTGKEYVYLYCRLGQQSGDWSATDGFEEWSVREAAPIPEPASCALLALAVGGVGATLRRRKRS